MLNRETPGKPDGIFSPATSRMVGNASTWLIGVSMRLPSGTPGPAMMNGTPAISSNMVDLPHSPRAPRLSPWSLVYITTVFSIMPESLSAPSTLPTFSSR